VWRSWLQLGAPPCRFRTVVVNSTTDPDSAIKGVLWSAHGSWLVLKQASIMRRNLEPLSVDGDVIIHRDQVSFIQVLP
jgi:hypothetical protein